MLNIKTKINYFNSQINFENSVTKYLFFIHCNQFKSNRYIIFTDAKAAEAAQSAYFDPNRPQMAYVPPPSYYVSFIHFYEKFDITIHLISLYFHIIL